ncbi:MAG: nucleotide exchange factor GrpE [Lachnospiraceae bacterium]|nr:nucleotide exchange factor GrpE [Lachnospiraceae bacterium]
MSEENTDKVINKETGETVTEEKPEEEISEENIEVSAEAAEDAAEENAEAGEAEAAESGDRAEEASGDETSGAGEQKKSWAERKAEKKAQKADKEKEELKAKVAEYEDRAKRQLAEFENFRNRSEKEKAQSFDRGAASVLEKLLPVVDNFERGFASVDEEDKDDAFVVGMDKIYKQLMEELDKMGVKPIEAVGKEFDPALHNAVMQTESDEYESGIVAQELLKGYTYHGAVLRHSMVSVVQ